MSRTRRVLVPMLAASVALTTGSVAVQAQSPAAECDYTNATPVTLQLQWVTQAQFAGYFAAKDLCYFARAGARCHAPGARPAGTWPAGHRLGPGRPGVHHRVGAQGARAARSGRAVGPGEHRPGLPAVGHPVPRVGGQRHRGSRGLQGQGRGHVALRQRVRGDRRHQGRRSDGRRLHEGRPVLRDGLVHQRRPWTPPWP